MYRYTRNTPLDTGQVYGDIVRDGDLPASVIQKFLASGILVQEVTPPLSEIPTFEKRADELKMAGVVTITDLVQCDAAAVAKAVGKSATTIRRWQAEAMTWLAPDRQPKRG